MGVRLLGVMGAGNLRGDCGVGDLYAGGVDFWYSVGCWVPWWCCGFAIPVERGMIDVYDTCSE